MQFSFSVLDPKTYVSPSGEYMLVVDPQSAGGSCAARYRLSRTGAVVWQGVRPFTLWDAGVTDAGVVGGYAYSAGRDGWGIKPSGRVRDYGDFAFLVLDAQGRERLHRKIKRVPGQYEHQLPQPLAAGMLIAGTQEHLIVRVGDPDVNRQAEEWWVFSLATGRDVRRLTPKVGMPSFETARFVIDARPVAGTPLVLLHWWCFGKTMGQGARFTLIDLRQPSPKPVWVLDLPHDYDVPGSEKAEDALMDEIRVGGAILAVTTPRQFTLRLVTRKQRVTFRTSLQSGGAWRVTQIGVAPYIPSAPVESPRVPEIRLTLRDRLDLLTADSGQTATRSLVRRPDSLIAAGPDRLAFANLEGKPTLVVASTQGAIIHQVALGDLLSHSTSTLPSLKMVWQGGTRFIVFCERLADKMLESYTEAYCVDTATGSVRPLAGFRCPPLKSVAAFAGGGFVALATINVKYESKAEVYAYDADGRRVWALTRDFGYAPHEGPEMLFSPEALTILPDGSAAILDNIRKSVQFYDRNGRYRWTLSLTESWKREPAYPSDIAADPSGGFVVHDFDGTPSVVWMNGDGSVRRGLTPRYPDGQTIANPDFCVAADGRLWVHDGYSLLGLDAEGRATNRIGDAPNARRLEAIAQVELQTGEPNGDRILVLDDRTRVVHVLDANGRRLHVCVPRRGAAEASNHGAAPPNDAPITLGPRGSFAINDDWFGADGEPRVKPTGWHTAQERAAKLSRRANGDWLGDVTASVTTPDGSLAILDEPIRLQGYRPQYVSLYSATNAPKRTITAPRLLDSFVTFAYDGRHVVLTGNGWAYCYHAATGQALWRFALPRAKGDTRSQDDQVWNPFLTDAGRTLCLFDGDRFLYRFAMP